MLSASLTPLLLLSRRRLPRFRLGLFFFRHFFCSFSFCFANAAAFAFAAAAAFAFAFAFSSSVPSSVPSLFVSLTPPLSLLQPLLPSSSLWPFPLPLLLLFLLFSVSLTPPLSLLPPLLPSPLLLPFPLRHFFWSFSFCFANAAAFAFAAAAAFVFAFAFSSSVTSSVPSLFALLTPLLLLLPPRLHVVLLLL